MHACNRVVAVYLLFAISVPSALAQSGAEVVTNSQRGDQVSSLEAVAVFGYARAPVRPDAKQGVQGAANAGSAALVRLLPNMCTVRPVFTAHRYDSSIERSMDFGDVGGNCVYFMALQSADPLEPRRGRGDGPNIAALIARAYDKAISLAPSPALAAAPDAVGVTGLDTYVLSLIHI